MLYLVYKTTNLQCGMEYIGCHATEDLDDEYYGSSPKLLADIDLLGKEHFLFEILKMLPTVEEMYRYEYVLVNEDYISRPDTYNMILGGDNMANWDTVRQLGTEEHWRRFEQDSQYRKDYLRKKSDGHLFYYREGGENGFKGKTHTPEALKKMKETRERNKKLGIVSKDALRKRKYALQKKQEAQMVLEQI